MRRIWTLVLLLLGLGLGLAASLSQRIGAREGGDPPADPKPVVLIVVDTLRRDHVSAYGGKTRTPTIDALAARGQLFTNAVASFHQTTMSMGAMFTGHTPSLESGRRAEPLGWNGTTWCGLARFAEGEEDLCLPGRLKTLAEILHDAGYWTVGVQSNLLLFEPSGFSAGFDDWVEVEPPHRTERPAAAHAHAMNRAVRAALGRRREAPLFLYVHYMDVHDYVFRGHSYARGVEQVDHALGDLLELLRAEKLLERARVVFTSDHGEMLGEWGVEGHLGNPSRELVLRVPLVVVPPTQRDPAALVRSQDLYALVAQLAGVPSVEPDAPDVLPPGELFLTELTVQTHREGPWKVYLQRKTDVAQLFDVRQVPEREVDASAHADLLQTRRARIEELAKGLAAGRQLRQGLTDLEKERLQRLGYLEWREGE